MFKDGKWLMQSHSHSYPKSRDAIASKKAKIALYVAFEFWWLTKPWKIYDRKLDFSMSFQIQTTLTDMQWCYSNRYLSTNQKSSLFVCYCHKKNRVQYDSPYPKILIPSLIGTLLVYRKFNPLTHITHNRKSFMK